MKGFFRLLITLCFVGLLFGGCRKKNPEPDANTASTPSTGSVTSSDGPVSGGTTSVNSSTPGASSTPATPQPGSTVPADLLADDAAYEAWFKKYGLDLNDPKMLDADSDNDGFSNKEEFLADTNPKDPTSRPGVHATIRLKEFTEVRVPYTLRSVDGETAKVEHSEGGEAKTENVKVGQTLRGSAYKVQKVESIQTQDKDGLPIDASKVTIEDPGTKQKIDLVKDMPARSTASYAVLTSPDGASTMTVRQGDVFKWAGDNLSYRVVDLRADQVILEQTDGKKNMWTVPKLEAN